MVAQFVSGWRKTGRPQASDAPQKISPKQAAILVTRSAEQFTADHQSLLDRLATSCPDLLPLRKLALEFREALTSQQGAQMQRWIEKAKRCQFASLVRFAYGIQKDISAVTAAVETPWSTGQVEGQINRLKAIKRQMYGRAGFDLLRSRILPYAPLISSTVRAP